MEIRIGSGWDSHAFVEGRTLWLGGVRVDHHAGLAGHSDGDVLLHAICDALLGALGAGDIGSHFPPGDPQWHEAASAGFVRHAAQLAQSGGWRVANLDCTLICEQPKIAPLRPSMQEAIASLLEIPSERVSIKAKTPEGLSLPATAIAQATLLLQRD